METWNINQDNDSTPGLPYSIEKLMSYGITVKSDEDGKVVGFDFGHSQFDETFELYEMTE